MLSKFKKLKYIIVFFIILKNLQMKKNLKNQQFQDSCGSTTESMSIEESIKYIDTVFTDYLKFSSLQKELFKNKKVLEIGPGDNLGVALRFIILGVDKVISLDRFYSLRDKEKEKLIYKTIKQSLDSKSKEVFDNAITITDDIKLNSDKLEYIYGFSFEESHELFQSKYFDFIVSRSVLEHINDLDKAFYVMDDILKPGGYFLHKIDLRDHNMFTGSGKHPLTFLTISNFIYKLMTNNSSLPNRKLINYYREKMTNLGYKYKIFITGIVGMEDEFSKAKLEIKKNKDYNDFNLSLIQEIKSKLNKQFKKLSETELLSNRIFLVAQKP